MKRYAIFSLICLLAACGKQDERFAYLEDPSGQPVTQTSDYPSVMKVILPEGRGLCTGTRIGRRAILTAAHCTQDSGAYRVISSEGTRTTYLVERLGTGQLGDPSDLAVLILAENFGDDVIALSLDGVGVGDGVRIVGYGCEDLDTRLGTGVKRTGTNRIVRRHEFLEIATPLDPAAAHRILGPSNLAGSCFGDSGGPMLRSVGGRMRVVGVAHAGGWNQTQLISRYSDVASSTNRSFFNELDRRYDLGLFDPCTLSPDSASCTTTQASAGIATLIQGIWRWFIQLF